MSKRKSKPTKKAEVIEVNEQVAIESTSADPANLTKQDVLDIIYAVQLLAKDHYGKPMGLLEKVREKLNG